MLICIIKIIMTQDLLNKAKALLKNDEILREDARIKGELYNVFSIMRVESDEVHTHSAIIADLLNPKGFHGNGDIYLNLFLQEVPVLRDWGFDTVNAVAGYEQTFGSNKKKSVDRGRIDILIKSGDKAIIIENKIYAEDQKKQLYRYKRFAESHRGEVHDFDYRILYLTLGGKAASSRSLYKMASNDYIKISYCGTINKWLEKCIEVTIDKPLVHETLVQYHSLIGELTRKKSECPPIPEISSFCTSANDLIALKHLDRFDDIMSAVLRKRLLPQLNSLANDFGLVLEENGYDWNHKYKAFSFFKKEEWDTFEITFLFEEAKFSKLRCGFRYIDKMDDDKYPENDTYEQLKGKCGSDKTPRWPSYHKCKGYANWQEDDVIVSLYNGKLIENIGGDLRKLLEIVSTNNLSL